VVICQTLTGQLPFDGPSTPAVLFAVRNAAPQYVGDLPADVQPIVYGARQGS
jgi:hypothetical protein